ncbi:hypothetical protein [Bradyrhizobium sp. CCBAU 65884]|uniref:hypothetical protein n=1 Tax=Bradyrhizobium sp. CCBAU 65884 TaxID=722477 RepID=UPI002306B3F4|nr:hypothetical protein [Bradyrhizobium sp. CCBAU 65884]
MLLLNTRPDHRVCLELCDADTLSVTALELGRFLTHREGHKETRLVSLPGFAREIGVGSIYLKDEGSSIRCGSFKALGGALMLCFGC